MNKRNMKIIQLKAICYSKNAPINSKYSDYSVLNSALANGKKDLARILLKQDCRINGDPNTQSKTPLHRAVQLKDMEILEILLAKGASLTAIDLDGNTPLHLAFILEHRQILITLLAAVCKHEIFTNLKNNMGLTYLHIACSQNGQLDIVRGLLNSGADIHDSISKKSLYWPGYTAMHFAIKEHIVEAAEALVQAEKKKTCDKLADSLMIDFIFYQQKNRDKYGHYKELTNFHLVCMKDNPKILERYIEFGASLNIPISDQVTLCPLYLPLHFAVEGKLKKNVEVLLKHGAMMDLCNSLKMTPLHLAFYHQDDEIVDLLWSKQKENLIINKKDFYMLSYLHMAVARNDLDVVKKFCDSVEDVNAKVLRNNKNFSHYSPLHFAVKYQHREMIEFLLDRGADVNVASGCVVTPMHLAAETGNKSIVELLLSNGAKVDGTVRNEEGQTILHTLVLKNALDLLTEYGQRLVEFGCDVDAKDSNGCTALHLACAKNFSEGSLYATILLSLGADINLVNGNGKTALLETRGWQCDNRSFDALYCHVLKLKAIGAKVCFSNEQEYQWRSKHYDSSVYAPFDEQAKNEIEGMKKNKLSLFTSLFDFLMLEPEAASIHVKGDSLKRIVEDKKLIRTKFPMYGYLIKLQFRRATEYSKKDLERKNELGKRSLSMEILKEVKRRCCRDIV